MSVKKGVFFVPDASFQSAKATPIWVLSLPQSYNRRKSISKQLHAASLAFEFIDAVDGLHNLSATEVRISGDMVLIAFAPDVFI